MDERASKLPFSATRVVKASRVLSWGAKAVWLEDWALDQGPEGAWISAANLAARLGMSKDNVEQQRRRLRDWGLYHVVRREGARSDGWCPQLPVLCIPSTRPTPDQIMTCATHLDAILGPAPNGVADYATVTEFVAQSTTPRVAQPTTPQQPEARPEGGRGEGSSPSFKRCETTLQPLEVGEVADATESRRKAEVGGETLDERRARFRELAKRRASG